MPRDIQGQLEVFKIRLIECWIIKKDLVSVQQQSH
jgi:hypothetical protein